MTILGEVALFILAAVWAVCILIVVVYGLYCDYHGEDPFAMAWKSVKEEPWVNGFVFGYAYLGIVVVAVVAYFYFSQ